MLLSPWRFRLSALAGDCAGGVAIMFALILPVMLTGVAVAVDFSYASSLRTKLQAAADAAALGGAKTLLENASGAKTAAQNLFISQVKDATPTVTVGSETVTVEARHSYPGLLAGLFGTKQLEVAVRAMARSAAIEIPCVLALEPKEKHGIYMNSDSKLDTDCGVQVNSENSEALVTNSSSKIKSDSICVSGGWVTGPDLTPAPKKCSPVIDPLTKMPTPPEASGACQHTDFEVDGKTVTMKPGVYCKATVMNSGANVTLEPGTYVFKDGLFKINSGSKVKGSGVLLFFTGSGTRLEVDSQSTLDAAAQTSGTYANIVIYQDRKSSSDFFILNSDTDSKLEGMVYLPNAPLKLNSKSTMTNATSYFGLIVRRLELNSMGNILIRNNDKVVGFGSQGAALVK
jgi:Flp pilus assembly protein TadG